jgi:hypothetical protein
MDYGSQKNLFYSHLQYICLWRHRLKSARRKHPCNEVLENPGSSFNMFSPCGITQKCLIISAMICANMCKMLSIRKGHLSIGVQVFYLFFLSVVLEIEPRVLSLGIVFWGGREEGTNHVCMQHLPGWPQLLRLQTQDQNEAFKLTVENDLKMQMMEQLRVWLPHIQDVTRDDQESNNDEIGATLMLLSAAFRRC